jgi:acyl carrier protein
MDELEFELKHLLVEVLSLKDITPMQIDSQTPLLTDGLGLDSIDALELAMAIGKRYAVKFSAGQPETREAFTNVRSLAAFVAGNRPVAS